MFFVSFIPFFESPGGAILGSLIGLPIIFAALLAIFGNWISTMLIILPFNAFFTKLRDRKSNDKGFIQNRVNKAKERYEKYGLPGLALISPLIASTHISAFASLAAGAHKQKVIFWHTISIAIWGIIGAALGGYLHNYVI